MRLISMPRLLILWDSREASIALVQFINELDEALCAYQADCIFVRLDNEHSPRQGQIKPSMKALLQQVHQHKPDQLICFGMEANFLGRLLKPALKCGTSFNQLPQYLEARSVKQNKVSSLINKLWEYRSWGLSQESDFLYFTSNLKQIDGRNIAILDDDPLNVIFEENIHSNQLNVIKVATLQSIADYETAFGESGLLILSSRMDNCELFIDIANANGLFVICVSNLGKGIQDGINGWVVESVKDKRLEACLNNWKTMGEEARSVLSYHAREHQSYQSGLHYFCHMLGLTPYFYDKKDKQKLIS